MIVISKIMRRILSTVVIVIVFIIVGAGVIVYREFAPNAKKYTGTSIRFLLNPNDIRGSQDSIALEVLNSFMGSYIDQLMRKQGIAALVDEVPYDDRSILIKDSNIRYGETSSCGDTVNARWMLYIGDVKVDHGFGDIPLTEITERNLRIGLIGASAGTQREIKIEKERLTEYLSQRYQYPRDAKYKYVIDVRSINKSAIMPRLNMMFDNKIGYSLAAMCGDKVKVTYDIFDTEMNTIENKDVSFTIGNHEKVPDIVEFGVIGMMSAGERAIIAKINQCEKCTKTRALITKIKMKNIISQ